MSFRRLSVVALAIPVSLLTAGASFSSARTAATPPSEPAPRASCVSSWNEARYRNFGYDHIVHLQNGCEREIECAVITDSNPTPVVVMVPGMGILEVLMFRGSPARIFRSEIECVE